MLRIEVAHAARSSEDTQRRTKRRFERMREQGIPPSPGRAFGFPGLERPPREMTRRNLVTGLAGLAVWQEELAARGRPERRPVADGRVERERAALVSGTKAALAKLNLTAVAREWNAAGLTTTVGKSFDGNSVRRILLRPRNAGLIEFNGVVVSRISGELVVAEEDFEWLRALLTGESSVPGGPPGSRRRENNAWSPRSR